jgi:type IV pilus assembly protein PilA
MLQKLRGNNSKGFTLIELMIVIAIIGILAAIAIPNFIAYRNKAFCSEAEKDANTVAGAIADWFAIPNNTQVEKTDIEAKVVITNDWDIDGGLDPNTTITIEVTDRTGRCPADYQDGSDYWDGSNVYTKYIR